MSMTHDEMIAVIAAHRDGKKIESCPKGSGKWIDNDNPQFNFMTADYRVKPEPLVLWGVYESGMYLNAYITKAAAESYASKLSYRTTLKKFVEVTE